MWRGSGRWLIGTVPSNLLFYHWLKLLLEVDETVVGRVILWLTYALYGVSGLVARFCYILFKEVDNGFFATIWHRVSN